MKQHDFQLTSCILWVFSNIKSKPAAMLHKCITKSMSVEYICTLDVHYCKLAFAFYFHYKFASLSSMQHAHKLAEACGIRAGIQMTKIKDYHGSVFGDSH